MSNNEADRLAAQISAGHGWIIKTLAHIVNCDRTDAQFDADVLPRDPIMADVMKLREAADAMMSGARALAALAKQQAHEATAEPRLPEPVAWRGLTQSYPYPQDNDWRYGPWVYYLDPARFRRLFTEEQMHAFREAGVSELRAEVERARAECDAIAELNHAQWLALENVRLLATRNRKEEWGQHMLRFCEEAGNSCSAIHRSAARSAASGESAGASK